MVIGAVIAAATPDLARLEPSEAMLVEREIAKAVRDHLRVAPFQIRFAYFGLACLFCWWTALTAGRLPGSLDRPALSRSLTRFSTTLPASFGAYERLSRSLTLLHYFDHPRVRSALGREPLAEHQQRFRALREGLLAGRP